MRLNQDYVIDNLNKFRVRFEGRIGKELRDYKFLIKKNITTEREVWVVDSYDCAIETHDGIETQVCNETGHYETVYIYNDVWDTFNPLGKTIRADRDYYVRIYGKRYPSTDTAKVDAIPTLFEQDMPEYDWWNSSWQQCANITITENSGYNLIDQAIIVNATGLTFSSTDEIRVVNAGCNETGDEIIRDIIASGTNYAEILFLANLTASTSQNYSIYYDNPTAPVPVFDDKIQFDNDCSASDCTWNITSNQHQYEYTLDYNAGVIISGKVLDSNNTDMVRNAGYDLAQFYDGSGWVFHKSVTSTVCEQLRDGYLHSYISCKAGILPDYFNYTLLANNRIDLILEAVTQPTAGTLTMSVTPQATLDRIYNLTGESNIITFINHTCNFANCSIGNWFAGSTYEDYFNLVWTPTLNESNKSVSGNQYWRIGGYLSGQNLGSGTLPMSFFYNTDGDYGNETDTIYRNYWIYSNPPSVQIDLLAPEEPEPEPILNESNLTLDFTIDISELGAISRTTCENNEWLRIEYFIQDCISEDSGYTPNCYNYTRIKRDYCTYGCYQNISLTGDACGVPDYTLYIIAILIVIIAFIGIKVLMK